jgi:hypothetical protein
MRARDGRSVGALGGGVAWAREVLHLWQNEASASKSALHDGQVGARLPPQPLQNSACSRRSRLHDGHSTVANTSPKSPSSRVTPWCAKVNELSNGRRPTLCLLSLGLNILDYSRQMENNRAYLGPVGAQACMREQDLPEGTVTVLFTDVEGSMALTQRLGDARAREVLRAHERMVHEARGRTAAPHRRPR